MAVDKNKLTDLRATAPAALEDISEEAWAEFQALQKAREEQFEATRPSTDMSPLRAAKQAKAAPSEKKGGVTLDAAMAVARKSNRVCPLPQHWKAFCDELQKVAPAGTVPPFPIDGDAWNMVPAMQKRMRMRDQLEWADRFGVLDAAFAFLSTLPEEAWLHF